nr:MAG TPA: hypothetical protein [Crassvirales sp.]
MCHRVIGVKDNGGIYLHHNSLCFGNYTSPQRY